MRIHHAQVLLFSLEIRTFRKPSAMIKSDRLPCCYAAVCYRPSDSRDLGRCSLHAGAALRPPDGSEATGIFQPPPSATPSETIGAVTFGGGSKKTRCEMDDEANKLHQMMFFSKGKPIAVAASNFLATTNWVVSRCFKPISFPFHNLRMIHVSKAIVFTTSE